MERKTVRLITTSVAVLGAFEVGLLIGRSDDSARMPPTVRAVDYRQNQDYLEISPAVRDAVARWKVKSGEDLQDRNIRVITLPDRICIKLELDARSLGGSPVYCYKVTMGRKGYEETTQLIYDGSDVE